MTRFGRALDRLHRVGMSRLADSVGDYAGASTATGIELMIDRSHEVYDEDQVAMRITAVSVQVADVPTSRQGDTIATVGRVWTVQQVLEDDGHLRRLWVS